MEEANSSIHKLPIRMELVMRASENLRQHGAMRGLCFHFLADESEAHTNHIGRSIITADHAMGPCSPSSVVWPGDRPAAPEGLVNRILP